jgi:hypothetical protein
MQIDDSKSMYSKEERKQIYKYVAARYLVGQWATQINGLGIGKVKRVSAYLYNHNASAIDTQIVGNVAEDFPEFEAQMPEQMAGMEFGTMTQWHDSYTLGFDGYEWKYIAFCIECLENALKLCE